jgi:hypothetical protein
LRAQDRQALISEPLISEATPLKKNGPRGPARGKGQRGTAGGTAALPPPPPPDPPTTPLGGRRPPGAHLGNRHGQGGKKNSPVRPRQIAQNTPPRAGFSCFGHEAEFRDDEPNFGG